MANLTNLGFSKGIISETIVTTYNKDGTPNAAPMGIIMEDEEHLTINLFNSSTTSSNIKSNRCAVVNLTSNIEVFYKAAFKEINHSGKLPFEWFEKASSVNAPKLSLADASIEVSVKELVKVDAQKTQAVFKIDSIKSPLKYPQGHSRAMSQTLEAIIHATRVKALLNDSKQQKKVKHLLEMIKDCQDVVNRVAPNSQYSLVMDDLMKQINSWRQKS